jgi:glycerophosphoryl diester phosphodiesterase
MDSEGFFRPDLNRAMVVGHRGSPTRHPDNTLAGLMVGLAVDGAVETDVRLSKDGRLTLAHDPELGGRLVAESTWQELAALDLGSGHSPCLLDEVLAIPGRVDLEVKNLPGQPGFDPEGRLALLVAARARAGDIVTSFYWPDMDLVRARAPGVTTGIIIGEGGSFQDGLRHCREQGHEGIAVHDSLLDRESCRLAREAGVAVLAWTVNNLDRARELSHWGIAAIISDHPEMLTAAFRKEGP